MSCIVLSILGWLLLSSAVLAQDVFLTLSKNFQLADGAGKQLIFFASVPHPFGSKRQQELAKWLLHESKEFSGDARLQSFEAETPNPKNFPELVKGQPITIKRQGSNVLASISLAKSPKCYVILGSHYDSKYLKGSLSLGANDSGSTSILLLHIGKYLKTHKKHFSHYQCDLLLVWFDGEEAVLPEWSDGEKRYIKKIKDNTYGSRHFTSNMQTCGTFKCFTYSKKYGPLPVRYMILLDMLGSKNITISDDLNSSPQLRKLLRVSAKLLGESNIIAKYARSILDDHIPFLQSGIPSLNIIDFENLHFWHKPTDTHTHVHLPSLSRAGRLAIQTLLPLLSKPQDF